jgi:hypothetical protein
MVLIEIAWWESPRYLLPLSDTLSIFQIGR